MKLNYKQYSTAGEPLLILHGLFGSLQNWTWHARKLSEHFAVLALDMRNHGASPHSDDMNYQVMADDILKFMNDRGIDKAHILGHSMGGKAAMQFALKHPQRMLRLVVADVAPVQYGGNRGEHDEIFEGLCALEPSSLASRTDADLQLSHYVDDEVVRQFLLSNLLRQESGGFYWRINLPVLKSSYADLRNAPIANSAYPGKVLFVRGELSDYILPAHKEQVLRLFPYATLKTITQTGHWLHAEKPDTFYRLVSDFLQEKI